MSDSSYDKSGEQQNLCYQAFGGNVQDQRKKKGLTARDLARFIEKTPSFVGQLESGDRRPSLDTLLKICKFFGKSPDFMLAASETTPKLTMRDSATAIDEEFEKRKENRETVINMLDTFNSTELEYLMEVIKGFKHFTYNNKEK